MRLRLLPAAALLIAVVLPYAATAAEKPTTPAKPTVVLRVNALDDLIADFRRLAEVVDKAEEAKQFEKLLKSMTSEKGLEGVDPTRPFGLYAFVGPNGFDSEGIVLLPVADQEKILSLITRINKGQKPEEKAGGLYKVDVEQFIFPIYLRFADKYLYATVKDPEALDKEKLLKPADVLAAAGPGLAALVLNLDEIPVELKRLALGIAENRLAGLKEEEKPKETAAEKALRMAVLDELAVGLKTLLDDGGKVDLRLSLDRKADEIALSLSLAGKADSKLAKAIAELGSRKSIGASLVAKNPFMSAFSDLKMPDVFLKPIVTLVEENLEKQLAKEKDDAKRKLVRSHFDVLESTLKAGILDFGVVVQAPNKDGKCTALGAGRIADGSKVEKIFREAASDPDAKGATFELDVAKVGEVAIHKVKPKNMDPGALKTFGDYPVYLAFREDALLFGFGPNGLDLVKTAIAAPPAVSPLLSVKMSLAEIAKFPEGHEGLQPAVAADVFKGGADDKIVLQVDGGAALSLRIRTSTKAVEYMYKIGSNKKL